MAVTYGLNTTNMANAWLNVFRGNSNGVTFTAPATLFAELHTDGTTADPSGTANVSAGSTTRLAIAMNAASGGSLALTSNVGPWTNGGTTENLKYIWVWSASTAGTAYFSAQLSATQSWASGNTFTLTGLTVSLTPLAA